MKCDEMKCENGATETIEGPDGTLLEVCEEHVVITDWPEYD